MPTPRQASGHHINHAVADAATARLLAAHLINGCCSQGSAQDIDALADRAIQALIEFRVSLRAELSDLHVITHVTPAHITGGHHG